MSWRIHRNFISVYSVLLSVPGFYLLNGTFPFLPLKIVDIFVAILYAQLIKTRSCLVFAHHPQVLKA
jgi:uncharacterized membrane protein